MCAGNNIPWYKKKLRGAQLQKYWQVAAGFTILLGFVVVPTWAEILQARKSKKYLGGESSSTNTYIQEKIQQNILEVRSKLAEENLKKK